MTVTAAGGGWIWIAVPEGIIGDVGVIIADVGVYIVPVGVVDAVPGEVGVPPELALMFTGAVLVVERGTGDVDTTVLWLGDCPAGV